MAKMMALFCLVAVLSSAQLIFGAHHLSGAGMVETDAITEADILTFALNLEYLEAEFYLCAVNGTGVPADLRGGGPDSIGCEQANLSPEALEYAQEIAMDELSHVAFLRAALGDAAVPIPLIDIGPAFAAAANAAFGMQTVPQFSPYINDLLFYHGAFIFEDVGVTAFRGAVPLLKTRALVGAASSLLGTESYHAGTIRTLLGQVRNVVTPFGVPVTTVVQAISDLRDAVDGDDDLDQGVELNGELNIVPTDENGLIFMRDVEQILSIVYLGDADTPGGFYPEGLNGLLS